MEWLKCIKFTMNIFHWNSIVFTRCLLFSLPLVTNLIVCEINEVCAALAIRAKPLN